MSDKDYLLALIAEGEHEHQDFKYRVDDAKKIARSISAFANNSGGHLLIGVKDNGVVAGISSDEEMYMVDQAAKMYCRPDQRVTYSLLRFDGRTVLKANIAEADSKPVKAIDDNGRWMTYYRVADENILASAVHVKMLSHKAAEATPAILQYTEREQRLLDYLADHGGITLSGLMRLAHCSRNTAEQMALNLNSMGLLDITYHNGLCLLVPAAQATH